jgi:PAS domain S-box-containing protein
MVAAFTDVTVRRKTERALRQSEERYRRLVEGSPDIVYSYSDVEGGLYFSPSVEPILGYPPEQFCSQRGLWYGAIHPDDQPRVRRTIEKATETGGSFSMEYRIRDASGNEHWFLDRSINIQIEEERTIIEGLVTDITARKRAEQAIVQASRLEATMTLAGGIAHKVNNLMASVLGYAEMLKMDARGQPDAQEMLGFISDSAQETSQLARQMLAFARGGRYMPQEIDLNDTIQGVLRARQSAISTQIQITLDIDTSLWKIEADAAQMSEVVLNLLTNAVEAIDEGGEVTVHTDNRMLAQDNDRGLKPGAYVCLQVQDTGCGMSEETLSRIFEPFFTTKFQGRGMGLAAVYGIVENHGGHISVQSQLGEGSTFSVTLPALRDQKGR